MKFMPRAVQDLSNITAYWQRNITQEEAQKITTKILRDLKELALFYPAANILVATKKDFEKKNRKKFCGRIATSDIDAVIIGHSQFEKIPLSVERQERMLQM